MLIINEPSWGVQPNIVQLTIVQPTIVQPTIVQLIRYVLLKLNKEKSRAGQSMTIIWVKQKLPLARAVSEECVLMEKGQVISSGPMTKLTDELVGQYLAV
jgi:ABC-type branched-subunit amino acid transport system ATPase component